MTLARTALRLAAVAALSGASGQRPTIAGNRVFDSRISAIDPKDVVDVQPILIVQTDGDQGDPTDMKDGISPNGGPPFRRNVDLVIECAMIARADDGDEFAIGYPITDAQLEASLDFLEAQVLWTLAYGSSPAARVFRRIGKLLHYESHRQASDEHGDRAAVRLTTLKARIHDHCPMPPAGATGFDRLPRPLSDVARVLDPDSYAGQVIAVITEAMVAPDPMPLLAKIGMGFDIVTRGALDGQPDLSAETTLNPG